MAVHADPRALAPDSSRRGPQDYRRTAPESIAAPPFAQRQRLVWPALSVPPSAHRNNLTSASSQYYYEYAVLYDAA